jgi:hypothetical protein
VSVRSTAGEAGGPPEAGLAARVAAGPGLWEDEGWLADLRRESLLESLLADGAIAAAAAAEHDHKLERALNAEVTALCLVAGALFPVLGYDSVLALVFEMPGVPVPVRPGTPRPTGPGYSKARARSGEAPARAMFGHDAARDDIPAGQDGAAFGLELTQLDGTTLELFSAGALAEEFGVPRSRREAAAPPRRPAALRHPPVEGRRHRPLPRRGECPGRRAAGRIRPRPAEPRRPPLLLHGPLAPLLRHRRPPALARQERHEIGPFQDH